MIAIKNLLGERGRLITSLIGVAFAVMLVLVMTGIFVGTTNQVTTYIDNSRGAVWVAQPGTTQMFRSVSWLPGDTEQQLEGVDGAGEVSPILGVPSSFVRDGNQTAFYLLGYDPQAHQGGPWSVSEGRADVGPGEVVLDRVLASKNGVTVGDTVELVDGEFTVVGLSDETAAVGNFYAFVTLDDAAELLRAGDRVSYYLVQPEPGTSASALVTRINEQVGSVDALTSEEFAENSKAIVVSMIGRPLYAMIAIGLLVGIALVALTVLATVAEQMQEFGVLKAVGVSSRQLYREVLLQAGLLAVVGYLIGAGIAYGAQFGIREGLGDVTVEVTPVMLAGMFGVTVLMAVLGSITPVRRVARLDAAVVFRR
ncbi:ABC transporter permease [Actinokineospora guangxiensis]|uniref:ABC transporter permease n=1 Tax=Actinokineospora guangxiensis TaxID=1490288 RepID=A0ABW0ENU2_9PSEU